LQAVGIKLHAAYCWDRQTGNGMAGNPETRTAMKSLLIMARSCLDSFYADLRQIRGERPFDRLVDKYYPRLRRDFPGHFSKHH